MVVVIFAILALNNITVCLIIKILNVLEINGLAFKVNFKMIYFMGMGLLLLVMENDFMVVFLEERLKEQGI